MRSSLSKKLFFITLTSLILFISSSFLSQIFFFQSFYENRKVDILVQKLGEFKQLNSYNSLESTNLTLGLNNFENETGATIIVFSPNGSNEGINTLDKNYNQKIVLESFATSILDDSKLLNSILKNNIIYKTTFTPKTSKLKWIGVATSLPMSDGSTSIAIAVTSIQLIKEANDVISEFYIYIFLALLIISIFLSLIYSKLVSEPLIKINKVAKKMSNMDFGEKCEIKRTDEIGNLAKTLNFLSSNLEGALIDLQEKNQKLQDDIEKERSLEAMRKDFVASVSHELKTPIGIIEGYAEGLKDGIATGEDALMYLDTIIDESKKMSVLVTNMLELSKLESGVLKPKKEVFNINRLIKKVIKKHSLDFENHKLTFNYIENTPYSYIEADTFQMEQVLTNILTNAIKYTPENNTISLEIAEDSTDTNFYNLILINYGTNIDNSEIDKLFNKFYRVDKSRRRNTNSTGLGLSIVKNILDLHHFEYSLKNIENGVEFSIKMPKANEAE